MKWATRPQCHVDRTACVWLIRRFIDPEAELSFYDELADVPADVTPFDMRGAELSHRNGDCSFERFLEEYGLDAPSLRRMAEIVHEADIGDDRFDAPEAPGLDLVVRALGRGRSDLELFGLTDALYDGLEAELAARDDHR
jgi:hypothetical protein